MKILMIDDSVVALEVAKARLAEECPDIVCANGGAAGLEAARRENPDLILLDVNMPGLSGFDVCRSLKADPGLCMIPVLFLSGSRSAEDKVKGLDLGAVDYIAKPFDSFELRARVRATLRTKHLQDLLIEHAHIDPLTALPNRRALMKRLQCEWARIQQHGGQLSCVLADIDHFKRVNDVYGHQVGDRMLQEVAAVIAQQCRTADLAARYGGEEFTIVMAGETATGAVRFADRCREEIAKVRVAAGGETVAVTASFGVAEASNLSSPEGLMNRADEALYRAKQAGRNLVCGCDDAEPAAVGAAARLAVPESGILAGCEALCP